MATPWTTYDPIWANLTPQQRTAAMALMEAGRGKVPDAMNAASAMVNRSQKEGVPIGDQVSSRTYQPTIEPSQQARLPGIVNSPEFGQLTDYVKYRQSGDILDGTGGATHFLAKPDVMLGLEAQNPSKYKNWGPRGANWTGYDPATGQYSNQTFEDSSHAFLAPEGRPDGSGGDPSGNAMADRLKNRVAQTQGAYDGQGNPVNVASGEALPTERTAQVQNGTMSDAQPAPKQPLLPMKPDETRAALNQALMDQALQSRPQTGLGAIGALAQYAAGMYGKNTEAEKAQAWKKQMRDALADAVSSGDRNKLIGVMAQNPETAGAAMSAMLAQTGPKAQDWQALPAQVDAYGRPQPARVMNKHTGEIKTVGGEPSAASIQPGPQQNAPQQPAVSEQPVMPGVNVTSPQAPAAQQQPATNQPGVEYGPPVPKAPEGYVHKREAQGFAYQNGQPVFVPKAELDAESKKREANQDVIRTNAQGADAFLRGLGRLKERITTAPEGTYGPVATSSVNQTLNRTFGTNEARQGSRDMTTQALRDLELSVAQMRMKGQGAITEAERAIARETLPGMDKPVETQQAILKGLEDEAIQRIRDARAIGMEIPKAASEYLDRVDAEAAARQKQGQTAAPAPAAPAPTQEAAPQAGASRISSKAEFDALPSGRQFIAPDGSVRVKP